MRIVEDDLTGSEIQSLLALHAQRMEASSPAEACHYLDLSGLQSADVTVWSIWDGEALAGCGALREIDSLHGEVKSMRTADVHLGRGVGRAVLDHIITTARDRGYERLSLETGSTSGFAAALHLYERSGFVPCDPFDGYVEHEFSRYFSLALTPSTG